LIYLLLLRYRKVYFNKSLYKYLPSKEKHKKEIKNIEECDCAEQPLFE
jgi:hypothetical protein